MLTHWCMCAYQTNGNAELDTAKFILNLNQKIKDRDTYLIMVEL